MEGTVIGQYRVLRKLGEGGMGAVYVGEHTLIGRKAAIKVLLPQLSAHQEIVQRFFNEARAATAVADAARASLKNRCTISWCADSCGRSTLIAALRPISVCSPT